MDLKLIKRVEGKVSIVEVGGEVELSNAPQLRGALMDAVTSAQPCLVADLSGVTFIDSTGIGVLVGALKRARESGNDFVLVCPQRRVRRVFEITGLLNVFQIAKTMEEALARVCDGQAASDTSGDSGGGE